MTNQLWWIIPSFITLVAVGWALFIVEDSGTFSGLKNIFALIPALLVSLISWVIGAFFK